MSNSSKDTSPLPTAVVHWRRFNISTNKIGDLIASVRAAVNARSGFVAMAHDAASLVTSARTPGLPYEALTDVLSIADGWPVALLASCSSGLPVKTSPGPEIFKILIRDTTLTHFIVGGSPITADALEKSSGANICGVYSALISKPLEFSLDELVSAIDRSKPDIVWVCLGSVKQLIVAWRLSKRLPRSVILAVGAALDFETGSVQRAPECLRALGLEAPYRLVREPRRLWRRYLLIAPQVLYWAAVAGLKRRLAPSLAAVQEHR